LKNGDMVRFAFWKDLVDVNDWSTTPKKNVGLLVEYDSLMQQATILYRGEIQAHRAQLVEKAGKKDGLIIEEME
jgi:hypothetical protein